MKIERGIWVLAFIFFAAWPFALYSAVEEEIRPEEIVEQEHLTPEGGVFWFGDQKETYYNLDMSEIVDSIKSQGWLYSETEESFRDNLEGEYWVREDGCKMLGDYIMVAANLDLHPRGSLVETSLGTGIVVDTGDFVTENPYQIDIAVNW